MKLHDHLGKLIDKVTRHWLLDIAETNPGILQYVKNRNVYPSRRVVSFAGSFPGQYLVGCAYIYKLTQNKELWDYCVDFADKLISYQGANGYLSVFSEEYELTKMTPPAYDRYPLDAKIKAPESWESWDAWSHYHNMVGLMLWYDVTGYDRYITATEKMAELLMKKFFNSGVRLSSLDMLEANLAPYHAMLMLYNRRKRKEYLEFARDIEKDLACDKAGDYLNNALAGLPFWKSNKPRWEGLHTVMGFCEMYKTTGDKTYLEAATQVFFSILSTDVHNTGAFSTVEMAMGTPFDNRQIETCCVVAYNAFAIQLLALTGDVRIAHFLEISTYNAVLGIYNKTGKWMTYNTPMDGHRKATIQDICFQDLPGLSFINCCASNAHRALGMIAEWHAYLRDDTVCINYYGDSSFEMGGMDISINGNYPFEETVDIRIGCETEKTIALRIPEWSRNTSVEIDGKNSGSVKAGEYLLLKTNGDRVKSTIRIRFDFTIRLMEGGGNYLGKHSIFRGPLLLGFDNTENSYVCFDNIPPIKWKSLKAAQVSTEGDKLTLEADGMRLNDFYSLGQGGGYYKTWLDVEGAP